MEAFECRQRVHAVDLLTLPQAVDLPEVANPVLSSDPIDDRHDELPGQTDFGHLLDLPDSIGQLRSGGVESLGCDSYLSVRPGRNHQVTRGGPAVTVGESGARLVGQAELPRDVFDLVFQLAPRRRTGISGLPGPGPRHENVTEVVNPVSLHVDKADEVVVLIQHRHQVAGSFLGKGEPAPWYRGDA